MPGSALLDDLEARGLLHDSTDRAALAARLADGPVTLYAGFDPTADSLHVGNLVPLLMLRRFQDAGHRPIALAGGATGLIGDPSGKTGERSLLDAETVRAHVALIEPQLEQLLSFEGANAATLVNNLDWTAPVTLLDFLRDVGKHATVNQMIAKESVRSRLEGTEGISYTEFTYMLLQAQDYLHLHETLGCELQTGGSDQWGNITAGIDLIRRRTSHTVHGLTVPLVTRADGSKFGKSEGDNVWLSAQRTSPYRFFQYWMNLDDADLRRFLLQLTLVPVEEANAVADAHEADPSRRQGQSRLAHEMTALVHGDEQARAAAAASVVLFGGRFQGLDAATLSMLAGEVPTTEVAAARLAAGIDLVDLLVETGLASSKSDGRRTAEQGGVSINGERVELGTTVGDQHLLDGRHLLLRKGKRQYHLVSIGARGR
jgi:tyrosyl-tRNA synthetase